MAERICSEIQTFDSRNKFEAFQQKLASLIAEIIALEVNMLQYELTVFIASSDYLSDAIQLDVVVADLKSLKSDVLDEAFSNSKGSLSSQVAPTHAQMIKSLTLCENRNQCFCEEEES